MIRAVIFDKDGTLFDFRQSWGGWTAQVLADLGDPAGDLARVLGFDPQTIEFEANSPVIAMTTAEIAAIMLPYVSGMDLAQLIACLNDHAARARMYPAVDLSAVLGGLAATGLRIGLATNDTEVPARRHLTEAGVLGLFDFVAGSDSGWGGKPAAGQLIAFADQIGVPAGQIAMVGDSLHDLEAGRRAGMLRVAVLTGIADEAELAPHADVVLRDIGGLADWIAAQNRL